MEQSIVERGQFYRMCGSLRYKEKMSGIGVPSYRREKRRTARPNQRYECRWRHARLAYHMIPRSVPTTLKEVALQMTCPFP